MCDVRSGEDTQVYARERYGARFTSYRFLADVFGTRFICRNIRWQIFAVDQYLEHGTFDLLDRVQPRYIHRFVKRFLWVDRIDDDASEHSHDCNGNQKLDEGKSFAFDHARNYCTFLIVLSRVLANIFGIYTHQKFCRFSVDRIVPLLIISLIHTKTSNEDTSNLFPFRLLFLVGSLLHDFFWLRRDDLVLARTRDDLDRNVRVVGE